MYNIYIHLMEYGCLEIKILLLYMFLRVLLICQL